MDPNALHNLWVETPSASITRPLPGLTCPKCARLTGTLVSREPTAKFTKPPGAWAESEPHPIDNCNCCTFVGWYQNVSALNPPSIGPANLTVSSYRRLMCQFSCSCQPSQAAPQPYREASVLLKTQEEKKCSLHHPNHSLLKVIICLLYS